MTQKMDKAAALVSEIFHQIDALSSAIDAISEVYVINEDELWHDFNHPVNKATSAHYATKIAFESLVNSLITDNLSKWSFRDSLRSNATMDALKHGYGSQLKFARKNIKDFEL